MDCINEVKVDGEVESSVLTSEQLLRQSLDRFDDKLLENILSYLTFSEKVLFESVSKRWQQLVYRQQKELHFNRWDGEDNNTLSDILIPIEITDYKSGTAVAYGLKRFNKVWMKSLLKKCQFIKKMNLDCFVDLDDLDIICRNCPQLKSIVLETSGLSAADLDHFGNRYGHMFESVEILYCNVVLKYFNNFLIHCKNVKNLSVYNLEEILIEDKQYLPSIEKIEPKINIYLDEQGDHKDISCKIFDIICDNMSSTLTHISISVIFSQMKTKEIDYFFTKLCQLKKLEFLCLYFSNISENEQGITKYKANLSKCAPNLNTFEFDCNSNNDLKIEDFFPAFEGFYNLENLTLTLNDYNEGTPIEGGIYCLKSSKNLKFLEINCKTIGEQFFEDIDKHLPNLCELTIRCESEITDKLVFQLSHLKKLKTCYLNRYNENCINITDQSVCAVINCCPALEVLSFGTRPNITDKTIETFIYCANTYPKRSLRLDCGLIEGEDNIQIPSINIFSFLDKIPENLNIDYTMNNDNDEE